MDDPRIMVIGQAHRADLEAYRDALDELVDVQAEIDRLQARRARVLVRVQETGLRVHGPLDATGVADSSPSGKELEFAHRSLRAEVGMSLRVSEYSAANLLGEAALLVRDLPTTLQAVECGRLTFRAAAVIAGQALSVDPSRRAEFDVAAVRIAREVAPSRLRSRLTVLRDRIVPTPSAERHAAARAERRVSVEDVEDGMSWLSAYLPSVEAHAIDHRLSGIARRAAEFDDEDGIVDRRTFTQRRADLLVELIAADCIGPDEHETSEADRERRFARGRDLGRFNGIRPTVVVTVPVQALLDPGASSEPAMLDGVVPIDPVTARELTANAPGLYRMLTDPHTGVGLDLGRERYQVSTELRLWLRLRDGTCRFPGCGRPARGSDVDHTIDWQYGGRTRSDNLAHLCRGHHTLKHQTRWSIRQRPDGTIEWRSPTGRDYTTRPAGILAVGSALGRDPAMASRQ
ncbi:MAG TPA: DUF222 domain-containing protein [Microbacteriaceae bacterium]|nr:DUF222 domain-containing protein [Microbacteriaceae bacterium]